MLNQKEAQQHLHKLQDERQLQSMTRKPKQGRSWQKIVQTKGYKLEEQLNKSLPRATKSFVVKLRMNLLETRKKLKKHPYLIDKEQKDLFIEDICPLCKKETESKAHIFHRCEALREKRTSLWEKFLRNDNNVHMLNKYDLDKTDKVLLTGVWDVTDDADIPMIAKTQIRIWKIFQRLWKESRRKSNPILKKMLDELKRKKKQETSGLKEQIRKKKLELAGALKKKSTNTPTQKAKKKKAKKMVNTDPEDIYAKPKQPIHERMAWRKR